MALGLTSIAIVTNTAGTATALTSGAFTPPASALLLPLWSGNTIDPNNPGTPTATDSLTPTAVWTLNDWQSHADAPNANGQAGIFRGFTPQNVSQTVTVNSGALSPNRHAALGVQVITGVDFANPIGQHGKAGSKSTTTATISHTPTRDGSLLFIAVADWTATGAMTVGANLTSIGTGTINVSDLSYGFAVSKNPGVRGVTANYVVTLGGTSVDASWVFVEVLPDIVPSLGRGRRRAGYSPLWRPGEPLRRTVHPQFSQTPPVASPVPFDTSGVTVITSSTTSAVVDISNAADNAWCYAWVNLGLNSGTVTATGWTDPSAVINADEGTSAHYALLRRKKQAGDTTFTFTWGTSTKGVIGWVSYTGLDPTTPDEQAALATNGAVSRATAPTPSATPTAANRWAVAFHGARTSTSGNKPITWTSDPALFERVDIDNNTASSPWSGIEIADSPTVVTQAAHVYTGLHNVAEGHDGSAILFLIPASGNINAPAEAPSAAGAASDANVDIQVNAEAPTATGAASDATASVGAQAGQPTATGTAGDASSAVTTNAETPSATGVAADVTGSLGASPGTATATGVANDTSVANAANAETPSASGTAGDGISALGVNAEAPTATGQAFDATVSTSSATSAPAETASGTGTAADASVAITANAEAPTATGAAQDASSALATNAETPSAVGVAADGTGSVGASPGTPSATGTAGDGNSAITVNAEAPVASGQAFDATVNISGNVNAPAETATGTGTAQDASTDHTANAQTPAATGAASDASGAVGGLAEAATASGTAPDAGTAIATNAETATASGVASGPSAALTVGPTTALATGQAFDATVSTYAVGVAVAVGQAFDATVVIVEANPPRQVHDLQVMTGGLRIAAVTGSGRFDVVTGGMRIKALTGDDFDVISGEDMRVAVR